MDTFLVCLMLEETFQSLTLEYDIGYSFVIYGLYCVEVYSFGIQFVIMKGYCQILSDSFPASMEMNISSLSFILLMWCVNGCFMNAEPSLCPRKKSHLIMCVCFVRMPHR